MDLDWQNGLSLTDCNRYMLENEIECDVDFSIHGSGSEPDVIKAHRYCLISRSPVFFAQLTRHQSKKEEIKIIDIPSSAFKLMLSYLYYEEIELTSDNVFQVLYAAKKYMIGGLSKLCTQFLRGILTAENVCLFLQNSFLFDDDVILKQLCNHVIETQSKRVFHSDAFYDISKETLSQVLRQERLSVLEVDVFMACMHWAERKADHQKLFPTPENMRSVLGDCLHLIHFPAMTIEQFNKIVVPTEVLPSKLENMIFRFLIAGSSSDFRKDLAFPFPLSSRNYVATKSQLHYDPTAFTSHQLGIASPNLLSSQQQQLRWLLTLHCDHSVKITEMGFLGNASGHVCVVQNGCRKLDVNCPIASQRFELGDDLQLDAGLFTITTDLPFQYQGQYYSRFRNKALPGVSMETGKLVISVRESSQLCYLDYIVLVPTDEIYFIENYYADDDSSSCACSVDGNI